MGNSKITTKSLLVVMAGLGGRRALELLAQGLVEVLAEDRQVQQQQQGLQQQAFQAGMAAAGVIVQQGSTVRPQTHRALSGEPAFQQQQVPLQAVMGPGPGMMGQYFAAAPGMAMMPGHGPALSHPVPTGGGAAVTPIVEEMHSPTFPEATSKSKAKPPGQGVTTVESSAPGPAADSAGATAAATVAAGPAAVGRESETPVAAPVAAPPVAAPSETPVAMPVAAPPVAAPPGVREVSLSPPADTSPADDSIVVERYRRAKQRPGGTSTTATKAALPLWLRHDRLLLQIHHVLVCIVQEELLLLGIQQQPDDQLQDRVLKL